MLTITPLRGSAGAAHYYSPNDRTRERRPDEYYGSLSVEVPTVWWSPGGSLGVRSGAEVKPQELAEAMAGRDPAGSGKKLAQAQSRKLSQATPTTKRTKTERTGAHDFHMAPPKTASILFAGADPATRRELLEEWRGAAVEVLAELHRRGAFVCREGKGGRTKGPAADVMAVVAVHQTARDGSPQVHVHCVVVNTGRRQSGKTGALEINGAFDAKAEAGALFRASIAAALERRGARVERVPGQDRQRLTTFRVAGVSPELEQAFSGRKQTMLRAIEQGGKGVAVNGSVRREQMNRVARLTRGNKAAVPTGEALEARWQATFQHHGMDGPQLWARVREAARTVERPALSPAETVAVEVEKTRAVVDDQVLRRRVAEESQFTGKGIQGALAETKRLLTNGWRTVAREVSRRFEKVRERLGQAFAAQPRGQGRRERDDRQGRER